MTKKKTTQSKPRIRGKGDYDFIDDAVKSKGSKKSNPIVNLESRISKLESRVPSKSSSSIGQAAGGLGRLAGGLLGQGDLGEQAGSAIAKWFGHGDYNLTSNSLISAVGDQKSMTAKFSKDGRGTRITEREYIGDVFAGGVVASGSTTFHNQAFTINPGNPTTFPWLATVANQFEQYEPHGIIFEFISTSSAYNGVNQALGTVIAATDYDPTDAPYVSKIEMESSDYANSSKASESLVHGVECAVSERGDRVLYVRQGSIPVGESLKFYDLGTFQIATQGMSSAGVNLGELWVSYDFTFYKKQLIGGYLGNTINTFWSNITVGNSTTNYFGTNPVSSGTFNLVLGTNTMTFPSTMPVGRYLMWYRVVASAATPPTVNFTTNCTANGTLAWSNNGIGPGPYTVSNATSFSYVNLFFITGPGAVLTWSGGIITTPAYCDIMITQVPHSSLPLLDA